MSQFFDMSTGPMFDTQTAKERVQVKRGFRALFSHPQTGKFTTIEHKTLTQLREVKE